MNKEKFFCKYVTLTPNKERLHFVGLKPGPVIVSSSDQGAKITADDQVLFIPQHCQQGAAAWTFPLPFLPFFFFGRHRRSQHMLLSVRPHVAVTDPATVPVSVPEPTPGLDALFLPVLVLLMFVGKRLRKS